jgi:hypothetical protein
MILNLSKLVSLLYLSCVWASPTYADDVVEKSPSGEINWTQGVIYAKGYGTAKEGLSAPQKRLLSRRAAVVDGQRNLLELTKGVRLTSMTKVVDQIVEGSTTATRVQGVIKGAVPVEENYQNDIYTVTLAMPIGGDLLQAVMPKQADLAFYNGSQPWKSRLMARMGLSTSVENGIIWLENQLFNRTFASSSFVLSNQQEADTARRILEWIEASQPGDVAESLRVSVNEYAAGEFSGLLIDATAVADFEIATIPTIRAEDGSIVYPSQDTSFDDIANKRGVSYDLDINDAVRNERVARVPLIIKAIDTYEGLNSDLVIPASAAQKIKGSATASAAMNKAGVMIVIAI